MIRTAAQVGAEIERIIKKLKLKCPLTAEERDFAEQYIEASVGTPRSQACKDHEPP